MRSNLIHLALILAVVAAGSLLGASFVPGEWYAALAKPAWTPPNWLFGPVWTVLYAIIGFVGARKFLHGGQRGLWVAQMALNLIWSPLFFGAHLMTVALVVIVATTLTVAAFIAREWNADRLSAALFIPYLVWLAYATSVNAGTVWLN